MSSRLIFALFLLSPIGLNGQSLESQNQRIFEENSIEMHYIEKVDSIQTRAVKKYVELNRSYDSTVSFISTRVDRLYVSIDSLQKLGLNTDRLTSRLDSLVALKEKNIGVITSKLEKLKSSVNNGIKALNIPPELSEKVNKLTSMLNKLDITKPIAAEEYLNVSVPELSSIKASNIPSIELNDPLKEVTDLDIPSIR